MRALNGELSRRGGALSGLMALGGAVASLAAGAVAALLAIVFTAALAAVAVMGMALVGLTAAALRSRSAHTRDPNLIEAHNIGGHSWVAYGWDRDGRKA
jgi:hypothetical protein